MDHGYFKNRVSGYLDKELPDYEMEALRRHLGECAECRALYEDLRRLEALVERHADLGGDEDYWEAAAARIEKRIGIAGAPEVIALPPRRSRGLAWKLVGVAASIAALTFIAVNYTDIVRQRDESPKMSFPSEPPSARDSAAAGRAGEPSPAGEEQPAEKAERTAPPTAEPPEPAEIAALPELKRQAAEDEQLPVIAEEAQEAPRLKPAGQELAASGGKAAAQDAEAEANRSAAAPAAPAAPPPEPVSAETRKDEGAADVRLADRLVLRDLMVAKEPATAAAPSLSLADSSAADRRGRLPLAQSSKGFAAAGESAPAATLADWRNRRDSLESLWSELRSEHLNLALPKARRDRAALGDIELVERQLLEAQVQVGRLAEGADAPERDRAIQFFRTYLELADVRYRETARLYLDELAPDTVDTSGSRR
ncbi:MAG TPA: zf-HC2 domain-containing protein [candidate division Zixibacteria bacterium]|nr:zf-HC2 domain-containing protein [candidate division Zixibacteria bacterium]